MYIDLSIKSFNNIIEFLGDDQQLSKCHEMLASIKEALTSENMILLQPNLPYITAMIENVYLSINSAITSANTSSGSNSDSDDITDFKQTFSVAPGQKHEKQVRFYRTTQKCGRKRKGNVLK